MFTIKREIPIVEVYYNQHLICRCTNMNYATTLTKNSKVKFGYSFKTINEKTDNDFWTIIRKGYVMNIPKELKSINLNNPDEVVAYLLAFYDQQQIKNEKELIQKLEQLKPLQKAAGFQRGSR